VLLRIDCDPDRARKIGALYAEDPVRPDLTIVVRCFDDLFQFLNRDVSLLKLPLNQKVRHFDFHDLLQIYTALPVTPKDEAGASRGTLHTLHVAREGKLQ
jgi:hypothetical protein